MKLADHSTNQIEGSVLFFFRFRLRIFFVNIFTPGLLHSLILVTILFVLISFGMASRTIVHFNLKTIKMVTQPKNRFVNLLIQFGLQVIGLLLLYHLNL